ncbi:MAG: GYD domain-containing protein [bacterium]
MATFIMAMSINPSAKKAHDDLSHQIDESLDVFGSSGVKDVKIYATLGRYDCLAVFETDDQSTAFRVASKITKLGVLDTETWPVIPFEEFSQILQ